MNKRRTTRYKRRLQVKFWSQDDRTPRKGVTLNVSLSGMFVSTHAPFKPGSRVYMEISSGPERLIFQGEVQWAARVDPALQRVKPSGMGLRLLRVDEVMAELLKLKVASMGELQESEEPSEEAEVELAVEAELEGSVFPVTFETPHDLANTFERDIKYGGLFVAASEPSEKDEDIVVEFRFDWDPSLVVRVQALVVKKFAAAEGSVAGEVVSGMGVAFVDPAEVTRQLENVIASVDQTGSVDT